MNRGEITTSVLLWGAGILASAIIGLSGYFVSEKNNIAKSVMTVEKDVALKGERIATTEANIRNMDDRLGRIEGKIDALLGKQGVIYIEKNEPTKK